MSLAGLQRYEKPACARCGVFQPECVVPVGIGARPMCWLCAHEVTAHDAPPDWRHPAHVECVCSAEEIYPADVIARRAPTIAPPSRVAVRDVVTIVTPSYNLDGSVDRTGPRLSMTLERVDEGTLRVQSVEPIPRYRARGR